MVFGIFGRKKPQKQEDKETFHITQGNISLDSKKVEALHFAIDEGMSDQSIILIGKALTQDLEKAEKELDKVV